ncbi:MAG: alpha/beta hydrolase [Aggregatilineales bacterium]
MNLTRHTLNVQDDQIVYFTAGLPQNPAVVLVHGWSSYHGLWQSTIDVLSEHYFCIVPDLLGFGESDKPRTGDYSMEAQGRRVLAVIDALDIQHFHLVGHSMGGKVALCIASVLAPERVLTLIDVAGLVRERAGHDIERLFPLARVNFYLPVAMPLMRVLAKKRWTARYIFDVMFYDMSAVPYDAWREDRRVFFQKGASAGIFLAARALHEADFTPQLCHICAPTLVIFGKQDRMVPPADGLVACSEIHDVRLVEFEHCGHFPMYECPDQYLETVQNFLAEAG